MPSCRPGRSETSSERQATPAPWVWPLKRLAAPFLLFFAFLFLLRGFLLALASGLPKIRETVRRPLRRSLNIAPPSIGTRRTICTVLLIAFPSLENDCPFGSWGGWNTTSPKLSTTGAPMDRRLTRTAAAKHSPTPETFSRFLNCYRYLDLTLCVLFSFFFFVPNGPLGDTEVFSHDTPPPPPHFEEQVTKQTP